jgi:hypothetical protein
VDRRPLQLPIPSLDTPALRLKFLADWLDAADDWLRRTQQFDLRDWECGAVACAVGWACRLPPLQRQGLRMAGVDGERRPVWTSCSWTTETICSRSMRGHARGIFGLDFMGQVEGSSTRRRASGGDGRSAMIRHATWPGESGARSPSRDTHTEARYQRRHRQAAHATLRGLQNRRKDGRIADELVAHHVAHAVHDHWHDRMGAVGSDRRYGNVTSYGTPATRVKCTTSSLPKCTTLSNAGRPQTDRR